MFTNQVALKPLDYFSMATFRMTRGSQTYALYPVVKLTLFGIKSNDIWIASTRGDSCDTDDRNDNIFVISNLQIPHSQLPLHHLKCYLLIPEKEKQVFMELLELMGEYSLSPRTWVSVVHTYHSVSTTD